MQSLARAFITAGASSVLSSVWDVDDAETSKLMAGFYANLGRGLSKASALRKAKLDALMADRRKPPSAWASFILIGEGDGVVDLQPGTHGRFGGAWLVVLILTVVVVAASAGVRVRRLTGSVTKPVDG